MSGTTTSQPPPTVGAAIGSMGVGGAVVVLINFAGPTFFHVEVPGDVSVALVTLLSAIVHAGQRAWTTWRHS